MNFCSACGNTVRFVVPQGDHRPRFVCEACGAIHYENPRIIVGCVPRWDNKVLLCKRTNEPAAGKWTLPAGFLENDETVEDGARRETREEANAEVEIVRLLVVYSVPVVSQVYLFFLADLKNLQFSPGAETEATVLFDESEIPWSDIAFSSVRFTLEKYFASATTGRSDVFLGSFCEKPSNVAKESVAAMKKTEETPGSSSHGQRNE